MSIRERKRMKTLCDNVDCEDKDRDYNILYRVKMREELGGHEVVWCGECVKRDRDMVAKVIFPICENCGAVLESFTNRSLATGMYDFYLSEHYENEEGKPLPEYHHNETYYGDDIGFYCPYCDHLITKHENPAKKILWGEVVEV